MAMWWNSVLALLLYLIHVDPSCSNAIRRPLSYSKSLSFTRSVRSHVQKLLLNYKEHMMGDKNFESRGRVLPTLPVVSFNYSTWILIKDAERLCWDAQGLQTFMEHLETQRLLLESEVASGRASSAHHRVQVDQTHRDLCLKVQRIQLDLRDLWNHVTSQLASLNSNTTNNSSSCATGTHTMRVTQSASSTAMGRRPPRSPWEQREEGYVVFRDLDRFLARLARDFSFLKAKHQPQSGSKSAK